jgi:allantoinase
MLFLRSTRIVFPDGVHPGEIAIREGSIVSVNGGIDLPDELHVLDVGSLVVLPGLVDTHVHLNDPGREDWEGFACATRAAAAGGVTTIVDMPLNSVPATTSVPGFADKLSAADGHCHVDVGFWGGLVPGNQDELEPLARAGVLGFKAFLSPSGVDEFPHVTAHDLRLALPIVARLGLPLLVHAELPSALRPPDASDPRRYAGWLASRPASSESAAIDLVVTLAQEYGARVHIVHVATAEALPILRAARARGVAVTAETCPHYLTFAAEDIADGATAFKCAPPIRDRVEREGLWTGLVAGDLDYIASDHSPTPPALKHLETGDFVRAWGGIASLQLLLPAVWTAMASRGLTLDHLASWLAARPAALAGVDRTKGRIAAGFDADLVVWDPDAEFVVDAHALFHRHAVTPYEGARLRGRVRMTLLGGEVIYEDGRMRRVPRGRLLLRTVGADDARPAVETAGSVGAEEKDFTRSTQ